MTGEWQFPGRHTDVEEPSGCEGENHHHWAVVLFRGWAKSSTCLLQVSLSFSVNCQIVSLQYLTRSSLRRLAIIILFKNHIILFQCFSNLCTTWPSIIECLYYCCSLGGPQNKPRWVSRGSPKFHHLYIMKRIIINVCD